MSRFALSLLFFAAATSVATFADGRSIGINFMGGRDGNPTGGILAASDSAGVHGAGNPDLRQASWNNVLPRGAITGSFEPLLDDSGIATPAKVEVAVTGVTGLWNTPISATTPDDKLMRGYLDTLSGQAQVRISGVPYAHYDVVIYMDGDNIFTNGSSVYDWRVASYKANDLAPVFFKDNATFDGSFMQVPPSSVADLGVETPTGNYIVFPGLASSSLLLTATPGSAQGLAFRAPLNAIQIIEVPEPPTALLLLIASMVVSGCLRRERSDA